MAGEIKLTAAVTVNNGNFRDQFNPGQLSIDQAAIGRGGYVQSVGTSEEVLNQGDVGTAGLVILRNLDATHFVTWGPELTGAMVEVGKLLPGEWAIFRLKPAVVLRAKADTAACLVEVRVYEN